MRGTAQNPDVFFQAREASNPFHSAVPGIVEEVMDEFAARTGRRYGLVDYRGAADAERVILVMGSAAGAIEETVDTLVAAGERVGMLRVRLFQPFPSAQILAALPKTVRSIAVLDRTKEPGAVGEPFYLEVVAALAEAMDEDAPPFAAMPRVIGGRYGLSSKELTPAMVKPIFDELADPRPKRHFTVGIYDDVTHLSLPIDATFRPPRPAGEVQAVFFGLGSDGTVGANKASVKIIGEGTDLYAQGYFVYDSKKSGSVTVSHLRFGPEPIRSTYLVEDADFVACHQFGLLARTSILDHARSGATFLLNAPYAPDDVWEHLPDHVQRQIVDKAHRPLGHRRRRRRDGGRDGQPDQHDHAALLLPARRGSCRRPRPSSASRASCRRPTRSAATPSWPATSTRSTARSRACSRVTPGPARRGAAAGPRHAGRRAGLRRPGDRPADRRRGRPAARQRAAGRRHVPDRHREVREARDRQDDPGLGPVHLHRLRQVRDRLPARDDPDEGLPDGRPRRRPRWLQVQGLPLARPRRTIG